MDISLTAEMKKAEDFFALYQPGDEKKVYTNGSLLMYAIGNIDGRSRYEIVEFLMGRDALIGPRTSEGHTMLHVLFSRDDRDMDKDVEIVRWLLERGVDVNARDDRGTVAFCELIINGLYSDDDLAGMYDLLFSQPYLDLTTPNIRGYSPIDLADGRPDRVRVLERMRQYAATHPEPPAPRKNKTTQRPGLMGRLFGQNT